MKWEAQRQALQPRFAELEEIPIDRLPGDIDDRINELMDAEHVLLEKIQTTPARTIEGALVQIEVPALCEIRLGLEGMTDANRLAVNVQLAAVATIRRLTSRSPDDRRCSDEAIGSTTNARRIDNQ